MDKRDLHVSPYQFSKMQEIFVAHWQSPDDGALEVAYKMNLELFIEYTVIVDWHSEEKGTRNTWATWDSPVPADFLSHRIDQRNLELIMSERSAVVNG